MAQKKNVYHLIVDQISGIFLPVINIITAASLLKSVVALLASLEVLDKASAVFQLFYAVGDGFFYFLPFFLAITASKQWKTDPFISLLIPVAMLYPDITAILENGQTMDLFGITVPATIYHSSVLPVLMAVGLLHFVEKPCDKYIHSAIRGFLKPMVCMIIVIPVTFLLFGPAGSWIGDILAKVFFSLYDWSPIAAGAFMGFMIQPMVVVGAHWSIVPVCISNISTMGYDVFLPLMGGAVYGQAGAALAVALMYKENKDKRIMSYQASFTAFIGTTEPALFGVNVPLVRPMISGCLAGAVGGAVIGAAGTQCTAFAFPSFLTCVAYIGPGFLIFLISMIMSFFLGFIFTYIQKNSIKRTIIATDSAKKE